MAEHDFVTRSGHTVYAGKILALRVDDVQMPGGVVARREVVEHFGAVAVVALDERDRVAMVYQYRHPVGRRLWELPAGLLDVDGEEPARPAKQDNGHAQQGYVEPKSTKDGDDKESAKKTKKGHGAATAHKSAGGDAKTKHPSHGDDGKTEGERDAELADMLAAQNCRAATEQD